MFIFFDFLFRLKVIYRFFDIQTVLLFKNKIKSFFRLFNGFLLLVYLAYMRNFYLTILYLLGFLFAFVDHLDNAGLVLELHEQGIFGNWKSTLRIFDFFLSCIILLHLLFGPFGC